MKNIKPSINTKNYVLDLSGIDTLNRNGVDSFLRNKNKTLPTTSDDSLMITSKEDVIANKGDVFGFHMKQSMILRINTLIYKSDRFVIVTASKIKSSREIVDATIELERQLRGYKISNLKITN
jgi:hypothetical protein